MTTEPDWNALLTGCIHGDWRAWNEFVECCYPIIMPIIYRYVRNREDAEDVAQSIFQKLAADDCRRLKEYDPDLPVPFRHYLKTVARNKVFDSIKSGKAQTDRNMGHLDDFLHLLDTPAHADQGLIEQDIHEVINTLPPQQALAARLLRDGLRPREIAVILGIGEGGTGALIHRMRQNLKERLRKGRPDLLAE